jgi:hypothetical protein
MAASRRRRSRAIIGEPRRAYKTAVFVATPIVLRERTGWRGSVETDTLARVLSSGAPVASMTRHLLLACTTALAACATAAPPTPAHEAPRNAARPAPDRAPAHAGPTPTPARLAETLSPRASCEEARAAYVERWTAEAGFGAPDLGRGQLGATLAHGRFLGRCGVPRSYEVAICAAVQDGEAVGVTVRTQPRAPLVEICLDRQVRRLAFPSHPRLDVVRTVFRADAAR